MLDSAIGVVLVQEDDKLQEHVFYYLSHALADPELRYSHVEKLTLPAAMLFRGYVTTSF